MRYFETFAGVGGFTLGIERAYALQGLLPTVEREPETADTAGVGQAGVDGEPAGGLGHPVCVGLSEIDRHASAVLRYRFPNVTNYGDITQIDWADVPDFDLLVGGSPCQDLSVAGKRAGLEGRRSGLFHEYVRALVEKKPRHFIWENVKGALSSNGGWDFASILDAFSEAGYSLWWQVLNARDFGVPQNRERVFVVGTRADLGSPREVFFESGGGGKNPDGLSSKTLRAHGGGPSEYDDFILHENMSGSLTPRDTATALRSGASHNYQTVNAIRRLLPVECERLMSWPDGHTSLGDYGDGPKDISDTQRYKMCGNGVVSEVVAAVVNAHLL